MRRYDEREVDRQIGAKIRERRKAYDIPMRALADAVGVSQQQLSRYESGATPVAASRLLEIAYQLQAPVGWFLIARDETSLEV